ncbi:MAG: FIST N-terminal domain-containing protein [Pikeienuella sp.]
MVDGLSLQENTLKAEIAPALREMPLFGGSTGDGVAFEKTWVALNGVVRQDAAVLTLVRTDLEARVFSIDHLTPTEE